MSADLLIARAVLGIPAASPVDVSRKDDRLEWSANDPRPEAQAWALRMWDLAIRQVWPDLGDDLRPHSRTNRRAAARPGFGPRQ